MLAVTAVIWAIFGADAATPSADIGRGWSVSAVADGSLAPLFVYPGYDNGVRLTGGFDVAHNVGRTFVFAFVGRAGGTFVDDWRPLFEGAAELVWRPLTLQFRAGVRHD